MSGETRIQVTKRSNEGSERCLYCHEDFEPEDVKVTCPQCDSPQHRACAMIHERCPTMGCTATWAELAGAGERESSQELSERAQALLAAHSKMSSSRAQWWSLVGQGLTNLVWLLPFLLVCLVVFFAFTKFDLSQLF